MGIEVINDNLCVNRLVEKQKKEVTLESSIIVPDIKPDIVKPIDCSGNICIYKKEVVNGKIKVDGSIDSNIMYIVDSETEFVRSLNSNIDFSEYIDIKNNIVEADIDVTIKLKQMECDVLNGRKVNLKAIIEITATIYSNENIKIAKDIKGDCDIQRLDKIIQLNSMIGKNSCKAYAKENIILENNEKLVEILKKEITIKNKDFKISYNKILAKADICVKILYLTEENEIKYIEKQIPVMGFIDMQDINENNICDVKYMIKNIIVKPNSSEDNSIYIEIEVEMNCFSYETKDVELLQDLYSPVKNISYKEKNINAMMGLQNINDVFNVNEKINNLDIGVNRIYTSSVKTLITNIEVLEGRAVYEGEIIETILFEASTAERIERREIKFPLNYEVPLVNQINKENIDVEIETITNNVTIEQDNSLSVKIELNIQTKMFKSININILEDLEEKEIEDQNSFSIIIYFVKKGDSLWKIAKKFKSTVDAIKKINKIEDENNLTIGMPLFIPRYVSKIRAG